MEFHGSTEVAFTQTFSQVCQPERCLLTQHVQVFSPLKGCGLGSLSEGRWQRVYALVAGSSCMNAHLLAMYSLNLCFMTVKKVFGISVWGSFQVTRQTICQN